MRRRSRSTFGVVAMGKRLVLIVAVVVTLLPLVWIVSASFSAQASLFAAPLFPHEPTFAHYIKLVEDTKFLRWVLNSLIEGCAPPRVCSPPSSARRARPRSSRCT